MVEILKASNLSSRAKRVLDLHIVEILKASNPVARQIQQIGPQYFGDIA